MAKDLSTIHNLVSGVFESLSSNDADDLKLSTEELDFYRENGYVAGRKLLDENQITALREELETFFDPNHDGNELWYEYHSNESANPETVLFHALGAWRIGPAFHDSLWNPRFTVPASQLVKGPVRFWHDQLFCKPPKHGGVVAWHQDYSYWTRTTPMCHLTCWIALDDSTADNGCLQYIPKSHEWSLLPITGLAGDMDAIEGVLSEEQWEQFQKPVAIELKAGECSFHHPLLLHGSKENFTDRPRRAFVINVFRDGVCSNSNDVLLDGVPAIEPGEPMTGQFFPLLYSG